MVFQTRGTGGTAEPVQFAGSGVASEVAFRLPIG